MVERIPVKKLIDAADPLWNVVLAGGEEVRVPAAGHVFVAGNVKHPGAFRVDSGGETTVLKAVALAEGLAPFSTKVAYIFRAGGEGGHTEIEVELSKIMDRKAPDMALAANDILYIPDNRSRRTTMNAIEKAIGFATGHGVGRFDFGTALVMMNRNESEQAAGGGGDGEGGDAVLSGASLPGRPRTKTRKPSFRSSQYFWILKRHRWRITGFVAAVMLATLVVSARLTPIYESTATVDIDRQIAFGRGGGGRGAQRAQRLRPVSWRRRSSWWNRIQCCGRWISGFELRKLEGQSAALRRARARRLR